MNGTRRYKLTILMTSKKPFDLIGLCQRAFFNLVAKGQLKHSIFVIDNEVGKTLECIGGLDFLYSLGVTNVVDFAIFDQAHTSAMKINQLDGLRPFYTSNNNSSNNNNNNNKLEGRHLIFLVSNFLWTYEPYFLNAMTSMFDDKYIVYDKFTILSIVSEKSHGIYMSLRSDIQKNVDSVHPGHMDDDLDTNSSSFRYDEYAVHLSRKALNKIMSNRNENSSSNNNGNILCNINIQYFPMHCRPLNIDKIILSDNNGTNVSSSSYTIFEINSPFNKSWFPALPHIFPKHIQGNYGNDMNAINSKDFPEKHRCGFKILSDILVCIMSQLNLDPRESSFCLGHEHSAKILGETTIMNLTDGPEGIILPEDMGKRKKISMLLYDRTVDLVAPSSLDDQNNTLDAMTKEKIHVLEKMQMHSENADDIVAQICDAIKSIINSRTEIHPFNIFMLMMRAASLLPPGSMTYKHFQLIKTNLIDIFVKSSKTLNIFCALAGIKHLAGVDDDSENDNTTGKVIGSGDEINTKQSLNIRNNDSLDWDDDGDEDGWGIDNQTSSSGKHEGNGKGSTNTRPSLNVANNDSLDWDDDDDDWGNDDGITSAKDGNDNNEGKSRGNNNRSSNAWEEENDDDGLFDSDDEKGWGTNTKTKSSNNIISRSGNDATAVNIATILTNILQVVNMARSHLNEFRHVKNNDGTYQPILSRLLEMFYKHIEPTKIHDLKTLKDYNAPETSVTESISGLLGGFFSMAGGGGSSDTKSHLQKLKKNSLKIFDRQVLFIFMIGGLTTFEVNHMVSTILKNSGVNENEVHILIGCTYLLNDVAEKGADTNRNETVESKTVDIESSHYLNSFFL